MGCNEAEARNALPATERSPRPLRSSKIVAQPWVALRLLLRRHVRILFTAILGLQKSHIGFGGFAEPTNPETHFPWRYLAAQLRRS